MALLSQLIRTAAITGRTDTMNAWFAGRQGGRWAEQTMGAAFPTLPGHAGAQPPARSKADRDQALRDLGELHLRGFVTDAELEDLRARLQV
jgi:hypothetical protein